MMFLLCIGDDGGDVLLQPTEDNLLHTLSTLILTSGIREDALLKTQSICFIDVASYFILAYGKSTCIYVLAVTYPCPKLDLEYIHV